MDKFNPHKILSQAHFFDSEGRMKKMFGLNNICHKRLGKKHVIDIDQQSKERRRGSFEGKAGIKTRLLKSK